MHQLAPDAAVPPRLGGHVHRQRARRWWASTRPSSGSSTTSTTCAAPRATMGIAYPIAIDNDYAVWDAFRNQYWPALYIADAKGRIRHHHFGEGGYEASERAIRRLLSDTGASLPDKAPAVVRDIERPADPHAVRSAETYVGLARGEGFASPGLAAPDEPHVYTVPPRLQLNQWALAGNWTLGPEAATSNDANARITYRFHARDLHLILAPPAEKAPARFRVTLDGRAPGACARTGRRRGGQRRRHGRSALSAHTAGRRHHGPRVRDRVPRSRRCRAVLHFRVAGGATAR